MNAKLVVMQLGTQYQSGDKTRVISSNKIREYVTNTICKTLAPINGGYVTRRQSGTVENIGYSELVIIIEFILPITDDLMNIIQGIRLDYCQEFRQNSVVTTISDCEALL